MDINYLWWGVQFSINFLDFFMIYVMAHAFLKQPIRVKLPHIILGVVYTIALAPVLHFWGGYLFRLLSVILMLFTIRVVTKRRNFSDLIVMLVLFTIILMIIQTPVAAIVWFIHEIIGFNEPFAFLSGQIISTILISVVSRKFKLNQWLNALTRNIVLKLMIIVLTFIILIIGVSLNFEYQLLHLVFFAIVILLTGLALFPILMQLYHNTIGMISVHDLKNSLLSIGIAIQNETDAEIIKQYFRAHSKAFGMDLSQLDNQKLYNKLDHKEKMTKQIEDFIRIKTESTDKDIEIISNITYSNDYRTVDYQSVLQWFGTLLDNALEATDKHPIYIHLGVTANRLILRVANEYVGHKGKDIQVIFEKGYTTKGEDKGRGIGLHNLYQEVSVKGGEILLDEYYTESHNCHYLQISILFSDC